MLQWLLIALTFSHPTWAADSGNSSGPTSDSEAKILWTEGKADFEAKKFQDAARTLSRYIDRYPSYPGYLDAQLLLGMSYLSMKQPEKALKPLKYYAEALGNSTASMRGRLPLGQTYLQLKKFNEAYLVSEELLHYTTTKTSPPGFNLKALLLKTEALVGMNRDVRANQALDAFRKELKKDPDAEASDLRAPFRFSELTLKTRSCSKFPSPGQLDEAQTRSQLIRKGDCLLEASTVFMELIRTGDEDWVKPAIPVLENSYHDYKKGCASPPNPPGKRTAQELASYKQELTMLLKKDCRAKMDRAIEILNTAPLPNSMMELLQSAATAVKKESESL